MAEKKQKIAHAAPLARFYRAPAFTGHASRTLLAHLRARAAGVDVLELQTEYCFYVETKADTPALSAQDLDTLHWLLSETFEPQQTRADASFLEVRDRSLLPLRSCSLPRTEEVNDACRRRRRASRERPLSGSSKLVPA